MSNGNPSYCRCIVDDPWTCDVCGEPAPPSPQPSGEHETIALSAMARICAGLQLRYEQVIAERDAAQEQAASAERQLNEAWKQLAKYELPPEVERLRPTPDGGFAYAKHGQDADGNPVASYDEKVC